MKLAFVVAALALAGCAAPGEPSTSPTMATPGEPTPSSPTEGPPAASEPAPSEPTPSEPTPEPEPTQPPTAPPPEPTKPTGPTPASPSPTPAPTSEPSPSPTPTPAANETPAVNIEKRHDYAELPEVVTFTIPEGATGLVLDARFYVGETAAGTYGCTGPLSIKILRPDDSTHLEYFAPQETAGGSDARCGTIRNGAVASGIPPGEWRIEFSGQGVGKGVVTVHAAS